MESAKHGQQWTNTLTQYAFPVIGKTGIGDVHADDIVRILDPIWQSSGNGIAPARAVLNQYWTGRPSKGWRQGRQSHGSRTAGYLLPKVRAGTQRHHASLPYEKFPSSCRPCIPMAA